MNGDCLGDQNGEEVGGEAEEGGEFFASLLSLIGVANPALFELKKVMLGKLFCS